MLGCCGCCSELLLGCVPPGAPAGRFELSPLDWSPVVFAAPSGCGAGGVCGCCGVALASAGVADGDVEMLLVDSSEPAAAPEFAELIEPEPLMPEASLVKVDS